MELVEALRADAVALQEAQPRHVEALRDLLPHTSFHTGTGRTGTALCVRHAPAETSEIPLAWRPGVRMRLEPGAWPGLAGPLDLVALHIAAPHILQPFPGAALFMRRRQLAALEERFADWLAAPAALGAEKGTEKGEEKREPARPRVVVMGDFNATPAWPVYRRMAARLSDAAIAVGQRQGRDALPTWGPLPGWPRMLRIDHAFTHGIEARELHVVALAGSDHSALVVDLPA